MTNNQRLGENWREKKSPKVIDGQANRETLIEVPKNAGKRIGIPEILTRALKENIISKEQFRENMKAGEDFILQIGEKMAAFDGVGGNGGGAAELARDITGACLKQIPEQIEAEVLIKKLEELLLQINTQIRLQKIRENTPKQDTTLALMVPFTHTDGKKYIATASVGDSSVLAINKDGKEFKFLNRHDGIITSPHIQAKMQTLNAPPKFEDADNPTPEELLLSIAWSKRNQITATGGDFETEKVRDRIKIHPYDSTKIYMVATDGLTDNLTEEQINFVVQKYQSKGAQAITEGLTDLAQKIMFVGKTNARSKLDDISVLTHIPSEFK